MIRLSHRRPQKLNLACMFVCVCVSCHWNGTQIGNPNGQGNIQTIERYIVCIIFINAWHPLQNSQINSVHTAHMNKRPMGMFIKWNEINEVMQLDELALYRLSVNFVGIVLMTVCVQAECGCQPDLFCPDLHLLFVHNIFYLSLWAYRLIANTQSMKWYRHWPNQQISFRTYITENFI